jgi:site-specific recombinase XerD
MNTPSLSALLSRYFVELRMNNWSKTTIDRRDYVLSCFITWLDERGINTAGEITSESVAAYRRWLYHHRNARTGRPLKFATQASYLSSVGHWLRWLHEQGFTDTDAGQHIEELRATHVFAVHADHLKSADFGAAQKKRSRFPQNWLVIAHASPVPAVSQRSVADHRPKFAIDAASRPKNQV